MNDHHSIQPQNKHLNHDSFSPDGDSDAEPPHSNETKGDPLLPKPPDALRIVFQNVNGTSMKQGSGDFDKLCDDVKLTNTDTLLIAEPNLH